MAKKLIVEVDDDLHSRIKILCAKRNITMKDAILKVLNSTFGGKNG